MHDLCVNNVKSPIHPKILADGRRANNDFYISTLPLTCRLDYALHVDNFYGVKECIRRDLNSRPPALISC